MTAGAPLRIGLVQDPDELRDALQHCLEADGLVVDARACADAVDFAADVPDLLLLSDVRDGLGTVAALRAERALAATPIVVLAPTVAPGTRYPVIAAGADEVLAEDVPIAELLAALAARVARARLRQPTNRDDLRDTRAAVAGDAGEGAADAGPGRSGALRRGEFLAAMRAALRDRAHGRVLLALRLDQARELGDSLGQGSAFELEQAVAARIGTELAPTDAQTLWMAFGFGVLAARASRGEIEDLAQRLCRVVAAAPFDLRGGQQALTASVGVALPPTGDDAAAADRWFASAHAAQAIAHRLGGNRFDGVLSRDHGDMPPERVLIIREWVKEAVSGENVQVEFQPAVPLRPGRPGVYSVQARLRDYRAPLAGVPRREYLGLARDAGALPMIDRMSLFAAFEAIDAERAQGRATRVLAPVDLASVDAAQLRWLDAELRRRRATSDALVVELDADAALGRPEFARTLQALEEAGVVIAIADASGDLRRIAALQRFPAGLLRLPLAAVDAVGAARFAELLARWRDSGRELLIDGIDDVSRMRGLWDLQVDYAQGDGLAGSATRLDYDFEASAG